MKKLLLTAIVPIAILVGLIIPSGCVKEDFDKIPVLEDNATWTKTATIAQVKELFNSTNNPARVAGMVKKLATNNFWNSILTQTGGDSSIVFEGFVISCDSASNFYETVTIMDETGGIDLKVNADELYLTYGLKPGKKVLVRVNDMALDNYHGSYQVGLGYTDAGAVKVTGLDLGLLPRFVQRSGKRTSIEPINLKVNEVNQTHVQKLVKIDSVQFWNAYAKYSIPGVNTNRILVDKKGNQIILRNSGYAKFMNDDVSSGSGSITGVMGVYDGTYQLYIRDLNDVQFTDPRFGATAPIPNKTVAELKALCTSNLVPINQDIVVDAIINANDESGNLYKQLFLEDETGAIEFKVDMAGLYTDFPVGTKVAINCNGLYLGKYGGVVQLGGLYNGSIGRLSSSTFYNKVFIVESGLQVAPIETTISGLSDNMIGKLVTISNIQFADPELGKTYAEGTTTTNRNIEDPSGNAIIVRTSGYANFAGIQVPSKRGKITAILSKFNSDYQLYVRSLADVNMIEPRIVKNYILKQDFSTATASSPISVDNWQSIAELGTRRWMAKQFSGDTYAEMNPYQSGEQTNVGWLISPKISLPAGQANYLSFETQYAYWSNSTLKVYISTNYDGSNPGTALWTEIPGARIVAQADGQNKWVKSGIVSLSNFSGDIYIGFKYTGSGTNNQTTAFRVDDVSVYNQN